MRFEHRLTHSRHKKRGVHSQVVCVWREWRDSPALSRLRMTTAQFVILSAAKNLFRHNGEGYPPELWIDCLTREQIDTPGAGTYNTAVCRRCVPLQWNADRVQGFFRLSAGRMLAPDRPRPRGGAGNVI